MRTCEDDNLKLAYLNGELSARQRDRVEDHLRTCPSCRDELAELRNLTINLRGLARENAPADLVLRTRVSLQDRPAAPAFTRQFTRVFNQAFAQALARVFAQPFTRAFFRVNRRSFSSAGALVNWRSFFSAGVLVAVLATLLFALAAGPLGRRLLETLLVALPKSGPGSLVWMPASVGQFLFPLAVTTTALALASLPSIAEGALLVWRARR